MACNQVAKLLDALGYGGSRRDLLELYGLGALDGGERRRHRLGLAALRAALREVSQAMGGDAPFILLKGEPLEELLFHRELRRSTGDVDLLVLPGDLDLWRERLFRLGYRRNEKPRLWAHNQEAWIHVVHSVVVELHWAPAVPGVPAPPLHELFRTRQPFRFVDGFEVDVLRSDWLFAHLVLHFHHHLGFARGLLDVAGWCDNRAGDVDLGRLEADLRGLGMWGIAQWPLHTLARLIGEVPPLYDDDADLAVQVLAAASSRAMRNCLARPPGGDLEATLVAAMPLVGPGRVVLLQAAGMLVLDGWEGKLRGGARPILFGPHRVGRILAG